MLNRKVIASQVTNLTDARYFAARGVDYLLFDLDIVSLEAIVEIKEWVEGPGILLLISSSSISLLDESIIKVKPFAISGKSEETTQRLTHLDGHVQIFSWFSGDKVAVEEYTYHQVNTPNELATIGAHEGVILSGGSEQIVGMKVFDRLDEILDLLEE